MTYSLVDLVQLCYGAVVIAIIGVYLGIEAARPLVARYRRWHIDRRLRRR